MEKLLTQRFYPEYLMSFMWKSADDWRQLYDLIGETKSLLDRIDIELNLN